MADAVGTGAAWHTVGPVTPAPDDTLLDGTHTVLTPEYVEFRFTLAGVYSRFLAWLLDAVIVGVATAAVLLALNLAMVVFPGSDAVEALVPTAEGDFSFTYTISDDDELREAVLKGAFYGKDEGDVTYTLNLDDYGTEKDITAP